MFNINEYETIDFDLNNNLIDNQKFNNMASIFIINETDLDIFNKSIYLLKSIAVEWSFLVNKF